MTGYYKLIDQIGVSTVVQTARMNHGAVQNKAWRLEPGVKYKIDDSNCDDLFLRSLRTATVEKKRTPELEATLKRHNIDYEVKMCRSCSGKIPKLKYNCVEVVILDE